MTRTLFSAFSISLLLGAAGVQAKTPVEVHRAAELFVSGTGVHHFTTAIIHSVEPTATGVIQRSTDTVELTGDLAGRILYHPVSVFDFVDGTLVNTGSQVFSGTVLGSEPVLLLDDEFRFEVDLTSGATVGKVYLIRSLAGPKIRCELDVVGTGLDAAGDATFDYTGECRLWPRRGEKMDGARERSR